MLRLEDCILIAETFDAAVNDPHSSSSVNPTRRLVVRNIILTHSGEYRYCRWELQNLISQKRGLLWTLIGGLHEGEWSRCRQLISGDVGDFQKKLKNVDPSDIIDDRSTIIIAEIKSLIHSAQLTSFKDTGI